MTINYTEYGTGKNKLIINTNINFSVFSMSFKNYLLSNYTFFCLHELQVKNFFTHDLLNRISFKTLDLTYYKSLDLRNYYDELIKLCLNEQIKKIYITNTGQYWHPIFLRKCKKEGIKIALSTADDDSSKINYCSKPYTRYYDIHFHVGVMYDKKGTTIADKLKEWGGNPVWIPLGARADHINTNIDFDNRDIEVCYIGNINPRKLFRLSKLKRHFGARLKLYGGQGNGDWKSLKGIFYKIVNKLFGLGYIEPISEDKLKEIYGRTKIGFNMHLVSWKGPSNSRMYELPINGVMQLCDNKLGLNRVFEVGKEVVAYENIHNAIQKIEYYLQNDEERIKVAKAGYERAIKYYTYDLVWKRILSVMSQD